MSRRFTSSFEIKVTIILLCILILVALTGFFTYKRFSNIISDLGQKSRPDLRLVTAKSLENNLSLAGNNVNAFTLTYDTIYLHAYSVAVEDARKKLKELEKLTIDETETHIGFDSLYKLAESKFRILNDFLALHNKFRVQEALNKVENKIGQSLLKEKIPEDTNNVSVSTNNTKKKFLSGIFKRKDKKEKEKEKEKEREKKDITAEVEKVSLLDVSKEVNKVRAEEKYIETLLKNTELALINEDKIVSGKIRALIDELEKRERLAIAGYSLKAERAMKETNRQIAVFCVLMAGLLVFMAFVIVNYVKNNNRFKTAMKKAKTEAENLIKTKERFFTNMSHEIRTPMNAIAGFTEQLADSDLDKNQKEQLTIVRKSVGHLINIINDVMDYSKLREKKLSLEKNGFRVHETIKDVLLLSEPMARNKNIALELRIGNNVPEVLIGDKVRLQQILLNLVSNAVKFTHKGFVRIKACSEIPVNNHTCLTLEVEDTGIGMNTEELKKVFNEFEQAEISTTRKYGGTGLGLSITKKLIELHHGKIEIKSEPDKGTVVTVKLPYKTGNKNDISEEIISKLNGNFLQDLNILVVDDEKYNRKLITSILKKYNSVFAEAENGIKALDELCRTDYDIILMDVRMPEMNGLEAVKKIRKLQDRKKADTPVIVLTAAISRDDQLEYEKAGMKVFLPKPFSEKELINSISNVLNKHSSVTNGEKNNQSNNAMKIKENVNHSFSLKSLEEVSNGDKAFLREMLATLIQTTKEGMSGIISALHKNDWKPMGEYAHKISSPCLHVDAVELNHLLKEIENDCRKNENLDAIPGLVTRTEAESDLLLKWAETELKKTDQV